MNSKQALSDSGDGWQEDAPVWITPEGMAALQAVAEAAQIEAAVIAALEASPAGEIRDRAWWARVIGYGTPEDQK